MAAGGVLVQFYQPGPRLSAVLQHFAAGVVFGALSIEMLPLLENATGWAFGALLGGYVAGVIVMLVVGRVIPHFFGEMDDVIEQHEKAKQEQAPERALDSVVAGDRVEEAQNDAPAAPTDQQHQLQPSAYAILSPAADADAIEQGAPHEAPSAPSAAVEPQVHHEMNEMVPHKLTRRKGRIPWGLVTPVFIDALVDGTWILLVSAGYARHASRAKRPESLNHSRTPRSFLSIRTVGRHLVRCWRECCPHHGHCDCDRNVLGMIGNDSSRDRLSPTHAVLSLEY